MAQRRTSEHELLEKIRSLSPEKASEVEDFIDFLCVREEEHRLRTAAARLSESAFARVWDHADDADYDHL
jgi:hypothetical protein